MISELLTYMADTSLIMGHRHSEWIGIGPVLEEDIAFGSMAQDKVGHAFNLYKLLHDKYGAPEPDQFAFNRKAADFKCAQLAELPTDDYAFTLVRQFLYDHAEYQRYSALTESNLEALAQLAAKFKSEIKYHIFHGNTWIKQLANGNDESKSRIQSAIDEIWPYALAIFEPGKNDEELAAAGIFPGEKDIQEKWLAAVVPLMEQYGLTIPKNLQETTGKGGRFGYHTAHLEPLLAEMTEVFQVDSGAEW